MKSPIFKDLKEFDTGEAPVTRRVVVRYRDAPVGTRLYVAHADRRPHITRSDNARDMHCWGSSMFYMDEVFSTNPPDNET